MTADSAGNDITAVGVPVTGFIGIAPFGTTIPTSSEGAAEDLTLDPAFIKLGLLKTDGGPQLLWAADGDPIEFWQDGYSIPTGLANVTLGCTLAEALADQVRELYSGTELDENSYQVVDGGGHATRYVAFVEEIFKSGAIRRRACPNIGLTSTTEDRNTRGEVVGEAVIFEVSRDTDLGGHFAEWVLPAASGS